MIKDGEYLKEKPKTSTPFPFKGSRKDKILFVLSEIVQGSAADVAGKLSELEGVENIAALEEDTEKALSSLCQEGLVECSLNSQVMIYNLRKG